MNNYLENFLVTKLREAVKNCASSDIVEISLCINEYICLNPDTDMPDCILKIVDTTLEDL